MSVMIAILITVASHFVDKWMSLMFYSKDEIRKTEMLLFGGLVFIPLGIIESLYHLIKSL